MAERITNQVLANELKNLTEAITKLEMKFDAFTPTNVLELKLKALDVKIVELQGKDKELEVSINALRQKSTLQTWLTGSLSAVLGSVLTFLVVYFLTHTGG